MNVPSKSMVRISLAVAGCLFAAYTNSYAQGKVTAEKERRVLTGDDKGPASKNPQCKLFSVAEASHYIGEPVTSVGNASMGLGCQWLAGGDPNSERDGDLIISSIPASYHEPPKRTKGYKDLPTVGVKGYVAPYFGGWVAGSIVGNQAIVVSLAGKAASESGAVELLNETIKRQAASASK